MNFFFIVENKLLWFNILISGVLEICTLSEWVSESVNGFCSNHFTHTMYWIALCERERERERSVFNIHFLYQHYLNLRGWVEEHLLCLLCILLSGLNAPSQEVIYSWSTHNIVSFDFIFPRDPRVLSQTYDKLYHTSKMKQLQIQVHNIHNTYT